MEQGQLDVNRDLLDAVRELAREQGRQERELLDEALRGYLAAFDVAPAEDFRALLDRMSDSFGDLDEDQAMELSIEEQQAYRRERAGGSR